MKCPNCDTENPQGAAFCLHCGKRLDGNIACPHCGKTIPATAAFCIYCGKRADEPATPNASASPSESAPAQPESAAPAAGSDVTAQEMLDTMSAMLEGGGAV